MKLMPNEEDRLQGLELEEDPRKKKQKK